MEAYPPPISVPSRIPTIIAPSSIHQSTGHSAFVFQTLYLFADRKQKPCARILWHRARLDDGNLYRPSRVSLSSQMIGEGIPVQAGRVAHRDPLEPIGKV